MIGIFLGLTFLTKQNIGIYLSIPTLFTKKLTKILKRVAGFMLPVLIMLVYLLLNDCLYEFIDYTFLGILSFTKNSLVSCRNIIIVIICIIFLIYKYIKTKKMQYIYLLFFSLTALPMFDNYHTIIAVIPTLGYFINKIKINKKLMSSCFILFVGIIFALNIYNVYTKNINYPNSTTEYKYRKISMPQEEKINLLSRKINDTDRKIFIISRYAYIYKLESKLPINKYDLLNNGNLGSSNPRTIIKEIENICNNTSCTFIVDMQELDAGNNSIYTLEIAKHISSNYVLIENSNNLSIYQNKILKK